MNKTNTSADVFADSAYRSAETEAGRQGFDRPTALWNGQRLQPGRAMEPNRRASQLVDVLRGSLVDRGLTGRAVNHFQFVLRPDRERLRTLRYRRA